MRRADRLFAIIQALRGGRLRTSEWLAEQLEVSSRTIYRDIAGLQANGVPIDGERGIGYLLRAGFFLPPLALTMLEHEALRWGVALVATHGDDALASAGRELLAKLDIAGAPLYAPPSLTTAQRNTLKVVREALAQSRRLKTSYLNGDEMATLRTLRPLSLEHWGKVWTLTAWCELREGFRVFRVDRIVDCGLGETFRPARGKQIQDYLASLRYSPNT
jgi:predicted DNA-binding transcriptional regulator YafY